MTLVLLLNYFLFTFSKSSSIFYYHQFILLWVLFYKNILVEFSFSRVTLQIGRSLSGAVAAPLLPRDGRPPPRRPRPRGPRRPRRRSGRPPLRCRIPHVVTFRDFSVFDYIFRNLFYNSFYIEFNFCGGEYALLCFS